MGDGTICRQNRFKAKEIDMRELQKARAKLKFWSTKPFQMDYGQMATQDYEQLKYDIAKGRGRILPAGAGLHEIMVEIGNSTSGRKDTRSQKFGGSKRRWQVIFAYYEKYDLVILVCKFRCDAKRRRFTTRQSQELAQTKASLDRAIKNDFERS